MLDQIAKHAQIDLFLTCKGDLHVDEHHTIEDSAIVLGKLFQKHWEKKPEFNDMVLPCQWMKLRPRFYWILGQTMDCLGCDI